MPKRKVLGKGLGALIPEPNKTDTPDGLRIIGIEDIIPNSRQPRQKFDAEELASLADNIKEKGVLQPLLAKRNKDHYELIAGERRWRASQMAGLKEVPVLVRDEVSEIDSLTIALIENLHRQDLDPIEEASAYHELAKNFDWSQEDIAKMAGKDRATIANTIRLLKLPKDVREMLAARKISTGHAKALLSLSEKSQIKTVAKQIVKDDLSVRAAEGLVRKLQKKEPPKKKEKPLDADMRGLQDNLTRRFGSKVLIKSKGEKGKIEIEYYNSEDLERIIELLIGTID